MTSQERTIYKSAQPFGMRSTADVHTLSMNVGWWLKIRCPPDTLLAASWTILDYTVLDHAVFRVLCKSIADASPHAELMKFVRQPGQCVRNRQPKSEQNEQANYDQRKKDDGLEEVGKEDRGILLGVHLDDCF